MLMTVLCIPVLVGRQSADIDKFGVIGLIHELTCGVEEIEARISFCVPEPSM